MDHRSSLAASETTYHSFNDIELFEPASPPRKTATASIRELSDVDIIRPHTGSRSSEDDRPPTAAQMKRQDSGYESCTGTPRTSLSRSRPSPPRRQTSMSTGTVVPSSRLRTQRSTRRSAKSYHHPNSSSVHIVRPHPPTMQSSSYFHFPSPDPADDINDPFDEPYPQRALSPPAHHPPAPQLPPQTTHYWTSDRTRRLEYAAIDAASRGVKGWIRRNLLPDCLAARDGDRHIPFDDDTGSVRRYRLELEDDQQADEKPVARKRRTWHFWSGGR